MSKKRKELSHDELEKVAGGRSSTSGKSSSSGSIRGVTLRPGQRRNSGGGASSASASSSSSR